MNRKIGTTERECVSVVCNTLGNWVRHNLHRNHFLKRVIEGKREGTGRRRRRRKRLLNDLYKKENTGT
jgi:hypothetical protein